MSGWSETMQIYKTTLLKLICFFWSFSIIFCFFFRVCFDVKRKISILKKFTNCFWCTKIPYVLSQLVFISNFLLFLKHVLSDWLSVVEWSFLSKILTIYIRVCKLLKLLYTRNRGKTIKQLITKFVCLFNLKILQFCKCVFMPIIK